MALADKYSEDEIFLLTNTPSMIGTAIAMSESSGIFGTLKESWSNAKSVLSGLKEYPDNELIQNILPNMGAGPKEGAWDRAKNYREKSVGRMKEKGVDSKEKFLEQCLQDCQQVKSLLEEKAAPTEASEYKEWAMSVAEKVAMSAKEGGFLGFGGERVSAGEKEMLHKIASALGTETKL